MTATDPGPTGNGADHGALHMPAPTPWPLVLALGMALLAAGTVTWRPASVVGAVLAGLAVLMLVREDLPRRESVPDASDATRSSREPVDGEVHP